MTYLLNNITHLKSDEQYKHLGVPKIHLEFEITSDEFLTFEVAELWLSEIKVFDVLIEDTQHKNLNKKAKKLNDTKVEKIELEKTFEESAIEDEETAEQLQEGEETTTTTLNEEETGEEVAVSGLKSKFKKVRKTITHEIAINVTVINHLIRSLNDTEVKDTQRLIRHFESFEEKSRKLSQSKNQLEGFIYRIRDTQDAEEFKLASTAEEREELIAKADLHSLYLESDEAVSALYEDFHKRYTQLVNLYVFCGCLR